MAGTQSRENGKKGGRPKGSMSAASIQKMVDKTRAREFAAALFVNELEPILRAQIEHAKGVSYMTLRHQDGSYTRATDEKQVDAGLAAGEPLMQLFTQAPNTQAFMALWDRTLDKPIERQEHSGPGGGPIRVLERPWRKPPKSST